MFGPNESIEYTFKPPRGAAVASLGKVLADRTTLYKYLNSHVVGVVTKSQSASQGGSSVIAPGPIAHSIYLLDGVTGTVLYHATVHASAGTTVLATMAENWLVYTYVAAPTDGGEDGGARGQHVVSVELYEGSVKNDRTRRYVLLTFLQLLRTDVLCAARSYQVTLLKSIGSRYTPNLSSSRTMSRRL